MSELVPGINTFPTNIVAPAILDPANGTEIKDGLEDLANRTFYLGKFHAISRVFVERIDAGFASYQQISSAATYESVALMSVSIANVLVGDFIRVETSINFSNAGAALIEAKHVSDLDDDFQPQRMRLDVGVNRSVVLSSWHDRIINAGTHIITLEVRIDAGTIDFEGPGMTNAWLMRQTT